MHSVAHTLTDVDLSALAKDQLPPAEEQPSSLRLEYKSFPGVEHSVVCDTSISTPRVLVPAVRRRAIFDAIHNLAHPSGKATLAIMSRSYVWPTCVGMCWPGQSSARFARGARS